MLLASTACDTQRAVRNVLITGTPRSGTTLVCSLLNKLPDTVALHEPMNVWEFPNLPHPQAITEAIEEFCVKSRRSLKEDGIATSTHVAGEIRDNIAAGRPSRSGSRRRQGERGRVFIDKPLSDNFALAIKHPVAFTAVLELLSKRFECFAIIRNPLATLASWNSLEWINVKNGHVPIGEKLDPDLQQLLASTPDCTERQLHILEWFYQRFVDFLPPESVIKYEDVVSSRGRELVKLIPAAATLDEPLTSRNLNKFYDSALMVTLGEKLLARESIIWNLYSKADVEQLIRNAS